MDQHPVPVTASQKAAGIIEIIGQTRIVPEWGQHPVPVMATQTAAGFD